MLLTKLFKHVGEYKKYAILTPLLIVFEVALEVLIPFVIAGLIDNGIYGNGGSGDFSYVLKAGLFMLAMALVSLTFGGFAGRTAAVAGVGFAKNLRNDLFSKVQDFSFVNIDSFSTPSLITRLTTDVTNVQQSFMMLIRVMVRSPIMLICATSFALGINWKLALIFLVAIPLLGGAMVLLGVFGFPRFMAMVRKYDSINEGVQEDLAAIRVVKTFVRENHESAKFAKVSDDLRKAQVHAEKLIIFAMPIMMVVVYACILLIVWLGGKSIVGGDMSVGELASFLTYIMQVMMSLMMLTLTFVMLILSRASAERIQEVLDEKLDIVDAPGATDEVPSDGSVVFENVQFCYKKSDKAVLKDISLHIKSGETVGIIGGTGAAKTSLVQLIPRLYDVSEGRVTVGGRDVREYKIASLRNAVAMVLQKNVLFSGTIMDNLKWGDENATDEEVYAACRAACAYDFVSEFPDGFQTDLGQGGVNVSGGQKQRLCIARALLKKPSIMILDDSTSAVDTATDARIRTELKHNLRGMTTIIIAQRLASVMDADRIIVLNEGEIDDVGTHDELLKRNEIYQDVYYSQMQKEGF